MKRSQLRTRECLVQTEADSETALLCYTVGRLSSSTWAIRVSTSHYHATVVRLTISLSEPEYRRGLGVNSTLVPSREYSHGHDTLRVPAAAAAAGH